MIGQTVSHYRILRTHDIYALDWGGAVEPPSPSLHLVSRGLRVALDDLRLCLSSFDKWSRT